MTASTSLLCNVFSAQTPKKAAHTDRCHHERLYLPIELGDRCKEQIRGQLGRSAIFGCYNAINEFALKFVIDNKLQCALSILPVALLNYG